MITVKEIAQMTLNSVLQWVAVALILIMAIVYIVRKLRRDKGCGSCELKDKCDKLKKSATERDCN